MHEAYDMGLFCPNVEASITVRQKRQVAVRARADTVNIYGSRHQASVTTERFFHIR